jgi:putative Mg2+ transporter-C (MgtC) family protein
VFRFSLETELTMLGRFAAAVVVGAVIGLERGLGPHPAGLRTLTMVSMGSAAFTLASIYGFLGEGTDTSRVAAQVATGVGFIGAGAIVSSGFQVRGLTTAAAIWMAAALGVAAGAGMYVLAISAALLAAIVLRFLPHGENG